MLNILAVAIYVMVFTLVLIVLGEGFAVTLFTFLLAYLILGWGFNRLKELSRKKLQTK